MAEEVAKKPTSKVIDTWKTKRWYKVVSPSMFGSHQIGETVAADESFLTGRTVSVSLGIVTGDSRKQNTNVIFEINKINNGVAETVIKKMEISPSSIRRMIRKGKDRIDLSLVCATKDNVMVRVKPLLITRAFAGSARLRKIVNMLDAVIRAEANKVSYENLVHDIITGKFQKSIRQRISPIYPLKSVEIRLFEKTVFEGKLPPVPVLPEIKEELVEETEDEKVVKKVEEKAKISKGFAELKKELEESTEADKKAEEKPKKAKKKKEEAAEKAE